MKASGIADPAPKAIELTPDSARPVAANLGNNFLDGWRVIEEYTNGATQTRRTLMAVGSGPANIWTLSEERRNVRLAIPLKPCT
jgi:hypothetical protein